MVLIASVPVFCIRFTVMIPIPKDGHGMKVFRTKCFERGGRNQADPVCLCPY